MIIMFTNRLLGIQQERETIYKICDDSLFPIKERMTEEDIAFGTIQGRRVIVTFFIDDESSMGVIISWESKQSPGNFEEASVRSFFELQGKSEIEGKKAAFNWPNEMWRDVNIKKIEEVKNLPIIVWSCLGSPEPEEEEEETSGFAFNRD